MAVTLKLLLAGSTLPPFGLIRNVREIEPIARATDFLVVLNSPQGDRE